MSLQLPPGQGPIDPHGAFAPPPAPSGWMGPGAGFPSPNGTTPPALQNPAGPPPPGMPPMMPGAAPRRGGTGTVVLLVLLILLLLFSFGLNVLLFGLLSLGG